MLRASCGVHVSCYVGTSVSHRGSHAGFDVVVDVPAQAVFFAGVMQVLCARNCRPTCAVEGLSVQEMCARAR